jgi:hypothetical protein
MTKGEIQERRWIVLGEDGRYVSLGRASDPTSDEILEAEATMVAQGIPGWLAVLSGSPYENADPIMLAVRPLAKPTRTFEEALSAFIERLKSRE